jgi:23S rRNA (uracil1939-C5)-methyltransferase
MTARPPAAVRLAALDEIEVVVEKLVAGGDGFARCEGIPLFVARSAPGDRLRVRLVERRPDYGRAEIVEVVAPGPGRRPPPCPHFARCGGCDLQHLDDPLQARYKAAAVVETLVRLGGVELPGEPEVVTASPFGYRLRAQLHARRRRPVDAAGAQGAPDPAVGGGAEVEVGYYARRSHDLVAVGRCPILVPELEALLPTLPALLAPLGDAAPRRLDLAAGGGAVTAAPVVAGLPHGEVTLTVAGPPGVGELTYAYDARSFFQVHRELVGELVARAVGPWEGEEACDLYAGVGLFSLPLARRYRRVTAVEGDRVAARYARTNARRNRVGNLEVVAQALESWIGRLPRGAARVVVDPPRGGLSRRVRHALFRARPERLTYVSCHPATLARDLKGLKAAYRVESVALLDLFPQSGHMEAVVQLAAVER